MKLTKLWHRLTALLLCGVLFAASLPFALADGDDDANEPEGDEPQSDVIEDPDIAATSALLINADTGMVLYEKDADEQRFPASTTKIMTALLVLEHVSDLSETVTAESSDFENVTADSSNAGIKEGETVTVSDLLYALMLPSANEAAYMLARYVGGTYQNFVDMMNQRAAELGCTGTHFTNPCGLHDNDHYTTARDLYKMSLAAMNSDTFVDIVTTTHHRMAKTNLQDERIIYTTNQLIFSSFQPWYYPYTLGIKTGHTSQAGNCLVSAAERGGARLFSVVMGCADAEDPYNDVAESFHETKRLFEWGFSSFVSQTLAKKGSSLLEISVRLSTDTDKLVLTAKTDLVASIPKNIELADMTLTPAVPESIDAPVTAGDVIGSQTYSYNGVDYGTVELVALTDVELSPVLYYADKLENFFQSTVFKVILIVLALFIVLYILFNLLFGGLRRRRRNRSVQARYRNTNYQRRRRR